MLPVGGQWGWASGRGEVGAGRGPGLQEPWLRSDSSSPRARSEQVWVGSYSVMGKEGPRLQARIWKEKPGLQGRLLDCREEGGRL